MNLDNATIIAGVCGPDNLIGYKTSLFDVDGYTRCDLAANCQEDKDFFNKITKDQFCVCSRITARGMSKAFRMGFPLSENIFPFYGPKILYTASEKLGRNIHDVIDIALKDAKRWNKGKDFIKDNIKRVYICGGAEIYKEALKNDNVREMYLTYIPLDRLVEIPSGYEQYYQPVYFPDFNLKKWDEVGETKLTEKVVVKRYRR